MREIIGTSDVQNITQFARITSVTKFGEILPLWEKAFGRFCILQILNPIWQIFIALNGQIMNKQSSPPVTLKETQNNEAPLKH